MRITNGLLQRSALKGLQTNLRALDKAQRQASQGFRIERPSEDPVAMSGILDSSSRLRAIDQYERNLSAATARLDTEDGVLGQLGNALTRARQLGLSQVGSTANDQTRNVTKAEIDQILAQVSSLGNTKLGDAFLFGGVRSNVRPFPVGGPDLANPPVGDRQVEGAVGELFSANHSGQEVFIDSGVLESLQQLSVALGNNSSEDTAVATEQVEAAFNKIQILVGEVGARTNRIESGKENLSALDVNLRTFRSDLQDVELEEAITDLISRQVSYEAALAANGRILNLTLTNYLR